MRVRVRTCEHCHWPSHAARRQDQAVPQDAASIIGHEVARAVALKVKAVHDGLRAQIVGARVRRTGMIFERNSASGKPSANGSPGGESPVSATGLSGV